MNFLAPAAFWFAAALPVVVLFYLLKRRRVVRLVPSTLLWERFLAETQANAPFQKLRKNWLLLLQLLLLVLAILALARPFRSGLTEQGRLLVVVLDASGSMQSADVKPNRFEVARQEVATLIDTLRDTDQMVLLQAGAVTEVRQSPTGDKGLLRQALQGVVPTDAAASLVEALKLGETLVKNRPKSEIHLFSDGASMDLSELANRNLPVAYHRVGEGNDNAALVALDVRPHPEDPRRRAVFATVSNFSDQPRNTTVELRFNESLLEVKPLNLPAGGSLPVVFEVNQGQTGVFTARLPGGDDLTVDDVARVPSLLPRPLRVLVYTPDNRYLVKALRAVSNASVVVAEGPSTTAEGFDVVVIDSLVPSIWPDRPVLLFGVAPPGWLKVLGAEEGPPIVDWKPNHPLLRFLDLDNVLIAESVAIEPATWAIPVVESTRTPLILAGERDQHRAVWVGFDVLQSTWPLRVSFPIFMANALDWLNPVSTDAERFMVPAGRPLRLALAEPVVEARIRLPDGAERVLAIETNATEVVFTETRAQGLYQVQAGTNSAVFCVNLLNAAESNLKPGETLDFGGFQTVEAAPVLQANLEIWRWLAAAALLVSLWEWWFFHRRTA